MASADTPSPDPFLGNRLQVFRPMIGNIVAGFIIALLLLAAGGTCLRFFLAGAILARGNLPVWAEKGASWVSTGLGGLAGGLLVLGGIALANFTCGLMTRRVEMFEHGFRCVSRGNVMVVAWTDIAVIRETILYERLPVVHWPASLLMPKLASTSYTVITRSGRERRFDGDSVKAIKRFGKVLRGHADRLALKWEVFEDHA